MKRKLRILFVCIANLHRSPAAEELYKNDPRYDVRSAGVAPYAKRLLTKEDIRWADKVFVMDSDVLEIMKYIFNEVNTSSFIVLDIPDIYDTSVSEKKEELRKILLSRLKPFLGEPTS